MKLFVCLLLICTQSLFAQDYNPRLDQLEIEIRRLTGEVETLKYQKLKLEKRVDTLRKDFEVNQEQKDRNRISDLLEKEKKEDINQIIRRETSGSVGVLYDTAQSQLQRKNYEAAEEEFKKIIEQYPDAKLAPNAYYWLGETYYARKNYNKAAITFLKAKKKYPDHAKAGHNLYKLGMSLHFLGEKEEACKALEEVRKTYLSKDKSLEEPLTRGMIKSGCY